MKASDYKELTVLIAFAVLTILAAIWGSHRRSRAPISPEVAFSPQMRMLLNNILDQEHVKHLPPYLWEPTPYSLMDVDESTLLDRKDDIARAASSRGDRALVELLTRLERWEKVGGEADTKAVPEKLYLKRVVWHRRPRLCLRCDGSCCTAEGGCATRS